MATPKIEEIQKKVEEFVAKYPAADNIVTLASEKLHVDKAWIAIGAVVIPVVIMFMLGGGHFIIDLIGYVYPAYASIKAIESDGKNDDTQWLTYWLVFSLFKLFEGVADVIINFIPFYFILKVMFLVWCYYPGFNGASIVYSTVIKPFVVPYIGIKDEKRD